jgi:hypothetical protein
MKTPEDPFSNRKHSNYRYETGPSNQFWIVAGNGPDGDEDLDLTYFGMKNGRDIVGWPYDGIYYGYDKPLTEYMYDPSNGMISNGDIIRLNN